MRNATWGLFATSICALSHIHSPRSRFALEGKCAGKERDGVKKASAGKVSQDTLLMFHVNQAVVSNIQAVDFLWINGQTVEVAGADWQDGTPPTYELPIH
jgi:hypothetical protein